MRAAALSLTLLSVVGIAAPASADEPAVSPRAQAPRDLTNLRARISAASVLLPEKSCAGAIAGDARHVLTAAHCIPIAAYQVTVRLRDAAPQSADIALLDRESDLAVLRLPRAAAASPLELSTADVSPGTRVHFVGRSDRSAKPQAAQVQRIGRCPSLPEVPNALFTSLSARPGDSGAPLVDDAGRVVGVIHGGASCHIAAPTAPVARRFAELTANGARPSIGADRGQPAPAPAVPSPARSGTTRDDADGVVLERTPGGFRFRWSFRWSLGSE